MPVLLRSPAGRLAAGLALAAAVAVAGCDKAPSASSDPAAAKAALVAALDAWKAGQSLDAHVQANPGLTVSDRYWEKGAKLSSYEIDGDGRPDGYDVAFTVRLTYSDGKKDKHPFAVSTTPKLVVVHLEPGG